MIELRHAAAGCMAVHRRVIDVLVETLPLCHESLPVSYWPFFIPFMAGETIEGDNVPLSEDYAFTERARAQGFRAWRNTSVQVGHLSEIILTESNMEMVHAAGSASW